MEPARGRTALLLSAGGMFGAYQAGAWQELSRWFHPDIVVGVSIGALNGWVVAARGEPAELVELWRSPECDSFARLRPTWRPWTGVFDSDPLHRRVQELWRTQRPRTEIGVVAVETPRLAPRLFRNGEIGWEHLAASCAVLFGYRQIRIEGKWYSDGGLLGALPVWAAAEMGAARVLAINALPVMPSVIVRRFVGCVRRLSRHAPETPADIHVRTLSPSRPLGSLRDAVFWRRDSVERWLELGRLDARAFPARAEFEGHS